MSMRGNDRIEKRGHQKDDTRQNSQSESVRETTIRVPYNLTLVFKSSLVWCRELGVDYLTFALLFLLHANVDHFRTRWFVESGSA
jgi:hypothetical protein